MIGAYQAQEFEPYGRGHVAAHPGKVQLQIKKSSTLEHGIPLVKAIKDISLHENSKKEHWHKRKNVTNNCIEELYIKESTVVWSRGGNEESRKVIKTVTVDSAVQQALWCTFTLPDSLSDVEQKSNTLDMIGHKEHGICIVESGCVNVFTDEGKDYISTLPFQVSGAWVIKNGLMFERTVTHREMANSKRVTPLPVLFTMLHPLDELAPVISKSTGGMNASKVQFVTSHSHQIVFTSEDPSLAVLYDTVHGVHSIWKIRRAKLEEGFSASGMDLMGSLPVQSAATTPLPGHSHSSSSSSLSRVTFSSLSPSSSMSPFRNHLSRVNSPASRSISSPSLTQSASLNQMQSPSVASNSLYRFQTPSPGVRSPACLSRTPVTHNTTLWNDTCAEAGEPLTPDVCLEQVWTDLGITGGRRHSGRASKVFITTDLREQQYLCYLIPTEKQLRCLKFEESNDRSQLIFGTALTIPARDAGPLETLNMMVVLDPGSNLVLYTGTTQVNSIHVPGIPLATPSTSLSYPPVPDSPAQGPFSSSRPPSAMDTGFEEEVNLLSPVPTEFNESSQLLDGSLAEELSSWQFPSIIAGIKDPVENQFTVELANGQLFHTGLPELAESPLVRLCLKAVSQVLPRDVGIHVLVKWYAVRNAAGIVSSQSEWTKFVKCMFNLMGYDAGKLALTKKYNMDSSASPVMTTKKARTSDHGTEEDWQYLLSSDHHKLSQNTHSYSLGVEEPIPLQSPSLSCHTVGTADVQALLFSHIPAVMFALHLAYENAKLNRLLSEELKSIATVLHQLSRDLKCEAYIDHYCRDFPHLFNVLQERSQFSSENLQKMHRPHFFSVNPPSIYRWLYQVLKGAEPDVFPYLPNVTLSVRNIVILFTVLCTNSGQEPDKEKYLKKITAAGHRPTSTNVSLSRSFAGSSQASISTNILQLMTELGITFESIENLPLGVALPLREAIYHGRETPPSTLPEEAYQLIGREDLAKQVHCEHTPYTAPPGSHETSAKNVREDEDGMNNLDKELLRLRFNEDHRIQEVRKLLRSSKPVKIMLTQKPEVSDHDFIEEQSRHLYSICIRTMALPLGRGMFTLSTYHPVVTETLPIPKLCLTGRVPPRNTTIDLSHIETPANMNVWPQFHNGVAAGLKIANSSQVDSTWIIYNKPKSNELTNEHAGFLMALGLNGHLSNLATMNVHDYLCRGHDMTGVGLLLGIAAAKRGTMDHATVRLLSIHIAAMLPPTSTELDVPHVVQVSAILGMGLVYQGTAHRHVAEVLLAEIGRPPGPEMDNATDRESYSLASGLALGMVMLGRGSETLGLSDLNMADQLYHFMVGGHKRPMTGLNKERYKSPSYQIKEGDAVNVNVTSPGATLALGMMFFKSNNSIFLGHKQYLEALLEQGSKYVLNAVAQWLMAPDTQFLLDFVRPDFLMLRVISQGLVLWDSVLPSKLWIEQNIPQVIKMYAFNRDKYQNDPTCDTDFETMSQAYCNIIAGGCMAIALKFAGSANQEAFECLLAYAKVFIQYLNTASSIEQAGKSSLESCLIVVVLSLAMVMAGTGHLEVLRICRLLRTRVGPSYNYVLYGSHMAVSMAVGLLFLGGGRYTLSTKPEAVAAMLCAFFPKFPNHSNDNRYHLQAFRHLYVLAADSRILIPRDVDTGCPSYVPLQITVKPSSSCPPKEYQVMAPCLLPELNQLQQVVVTGERYWPVSFCADQNWNKLQHILSTSGTLYVKQRAGHLTYMEDPKGYHSLLAKSFVSDKGGHQRVQPEVIKSFTSDARILSFTESFCKEHSDQEYPQTSMLSSLLHECVTQEKPEMLSMYIELHQIIGSLSQGLDSMKCWQVKLALALYRRFGSERRLLATEFLLAAESKINVIFEEWLKGHPSSVAKYFSSHQCDEFVDATFLGTFLVWHDLPLPGYFQNQDLKALQEFPQFYSEYKQTGLSIGSLLKLFNVLRGCHPS